MRKQRDKGKPTSKTGLASPPLFFVRSQLTYMQTQGQGVQDVQPKNTMPGLAVPDMSWSCRQVIERSYANKQLLGNPNPMYDEELPDFHLMDEIDLLQYRSVLMEELDERQRSLDEASRQLAQKHHEHAMQQYDEWRRRNEPPTPSPTPPIEE